jgi:hypothetical protein
MNSWIAYAKVYMTCSALREEEESGRFVLSISAK